MLGPDLFLFLFLALSVLVPEKGSFRWHRLMGILAARNLL
jgi:hypothetical protein